MVDPNTIACGDNCNVLRDVHPECIDLVVTSPPYDDLREYGGQPWSFEGIAWQLYRLLKPGGVIVWVVGDQTIDGSETGTSFRQALHFQELGLRIHDTMLYASDGCPGASNRYRSEFEYCFVISKGAPKTFNPLTEPCVWAGFGTSSTRRQRDGQLKSDGRRVTKKTKPRGNIWRYETGNIGKSGHSRTTTQWGPTSHPAAFPIGLATDHILSWSNEGDLVLDPFCGSGTTCVASKRLNREWIGIDVHQEYCELARSRLAQQMLPI